MLPVTHMFIHEWNETYRKYQAVELAAEHHRTLAGTHFLSR